MNTYRPSKETAASLLGIVHGALAREAHGVDVLAWPSTPLGPLWGEMADGRLRCVKWGVPDGYVVRPLEGAAECLQMALQGYFEGNTLQLEWECFAPKGTDFQRKVWQALCEITWGKTVSYGELAERVGSHARAVGGAVGSNPVPILIPCHRVMGKDGSLTGFSAPGGLVTKTWLLKHEGIMS
ncbi:MAG: methylated-DNA--[protein]-cysteine S-methyltransferase [Alphaproteobacteria bacterium]